MKVTAKYLNEIKYASGTIRYTAHCNILENGASVAKEYAVRNYGYGQTTKRYKLQEHDRGTTWHLVFDTKVEAIDALNKAIEIQLGCIRVSKTKIDLPL